MGWLDVEGGGGKKALLLTVGLDVLGDVGFVLGNALNEFTASRENVTEVVVMISGVCRIVWGAGGA